MRPPAPRVAVAGLLVAAACSSGPARPTPLPSPNVDSDAPYVVSAIDYHFHDAHPSRPISLGRPLVIKNHGHNVHNVTFPGTGYDRNVAPGARLTIDPVGSLLPGPGEYRFFCRFHVDRDMTGVIVLVDDGR